MPPRVYVETSVISYLAARPSRDLITAARQQLTHEWWRGRRSQFDVCVSQLVLDEASAGDPEAAARRAAFLVGLPLLDVTPAAVGLARLELGAHRERRVSPASRTHVSRPWLRASGALYAG